MVGISPTKATSLAARFHRLAARKGKKRAIGAVAHPILVSRYDMLKHKEPSHEREPTCESVARRRMSSGTLVKRLERLGLHMTVRSAEETAALLA